MGGRDLLEVICFGCLEHGRVSIKDYLASLQGESDGEEGVFTIAAERAEKLLSERVLKDVWQAWLCLVQGLARFGVPYLCVETGNSAIQLDTGLAGQGVPARKLLGEDRLLLGWLNLRWFGQPQWDSESGLLTIALSGSPWRRYRLVRSLRSYLLRHLCQLRLSVKLDGRPLPQGSLPEAKRYSFFEPSPDDRFALQFPSAKALEPMTRARFFPLGERTEVLQQWPSDDCFSAVAYRTNSSWSQVYWVQDGVIICEARNTLERPGLAVIASVNSVGLSTDLSGFEVVADAAYHKFANQVKKNVLWML